MHELDLSEIAAAHGGTGPTLPHPGSLLEYRPASVAGVEIAAPQHSALTSDPGPLHDWWGVGIDSRGLPGGRWNEWYFPAADQAIAFLDLSLKHLGRQISPPV